MMTLREHIRRFTGTPSPFATEPALEPIYRALFQRELAKIGEVDDFFPVGGAANYSLLYLILQVGVQLRPRSVLDIGAGQSSRLWSMLHRAGYVGDVLTLESDASWGARIAAQVDHEVLVTPLASTRAGGRASLTYDWPRARAGRRFDAMVCDGPNGTRRHSRSGILAMLDDTLPDDVVLILDDAERPGEQDTVTAIHKRLQQLGADYGVGVTRAAKTQAIFATGAYRPAIYL
ncbi:hypothetical protein [Sphingomonas sp. CROZ-RG-20F-R02-07]|uniref:hypothetical protein n=1 Tax=Sphingomonas sp. CROZ-RG-20F-R02-07 TaxID=2914832 RepID=UPI001F58A5C3|nr:hypothetical protein [Sphingomonas sp. CROZ-RG-20F-R02-07]